MVVAGFMKNLLEIKWHTYGLTTAHLLAVETLISKVEQDKIGWQATMDISGGGIELREDIYTNILTNTGFYSVQITSMF